MLSCFQIFIAAFLHHFRRGVFFTQMLPRLRRCRFAAFRRMPDYDASLRCCQLFFSHAATLIIAMPPPSRHAYYADAFLSPLYAGAAALSRRAMLISLAILLAYFCCCFRHAMPLLMLLPLYALPICCRCHADAASFFFSRTLPLILAAICYADILMLFAFLLSPLILLCYAFRHAAAYDADFSPRHFFSRFRFLLRFDYFLH